MSTELTLSREQAEARLTELESVIEKGLSNFLEVGNALLEVNQDRLYKLEYQRFEDYCRDRWGFSRQYAYRLIEAAEAHAEEESEESGEEDNPEILSTDGLQKSRVRDAKNAHQASKAIGAAKAAAKAKEPKPEPPPLTDKVGKAVPKHLADVFTEGMQAFNTLEALIDQVGRSLVDVSQVEAGVLIHLQTVQSDLRNVKRAVLAAKPHAVCPYCKADAKTCTACRGAGWVNRSIYDGAPAEKRK